MKTPVVEDTRRPRRDGLGSTLAYALPALRPGRGNATTPKRVLDPEALGDHFDRLYRAAWALCGSREDAEDLVQDVYSRVLARPRIVRNDDGLGYLLRVLRNTFISAAPAGAVRARRASHRRC